MADHPVEVKHLFVKEKHLCNELRIEHIDGTNQIADTFTKALDRGRFEKMRLELGVLEIFEVIVQMLISGGSVVI